MPAKAFLKSIMTGCVALAATIFVGVGFVAAEGFNYARYKPTDLDELVERKRPTDGADLFPGVPLKIVVKLESYAEPCNVGFLKRTMVIGGMRNDAVQITRCVNVRTAKNKVVPLYIQDQVAEFLLKEIPLGSAVTLFAIHMFTTSDRVGLLVNEFSAGGPVKI